MPWEGVINFTGATIQWLRDQLHLIQFVDETERLAESVEDNGGVYLIPAFVGLGAPYWRSDSRAAILGLTPKATRAHVVRAGLESIGYTINDVVEHMESESCLELSKVCADGGATRNKFLMQFVSDITQMRITVSETPELSALGAVFAGLLCTGIIPSTEDLERINLNTYSVTPHLSQEKRKAWIQGWKQALAKIIN